MDIATIGAIVGVIGLSGTLVALAKFWMDMGKTDARVEAAAASAALAHAKLELLTTNLNDYKLSASEKFASGHDIVAAEQRFATAVDGLGARFDHMAARLDQVLANMLSRPHS